MSDNPFNGSRTTNWYIEELTPGVTPDNPAWTRIRDTGGIPAIISDTITSAELDDSREIIGFDISNRRSEMELGFELSSQSQDELFAGAMTSTWQSGFTTTGVEVTVDATAKTYTRTAGDYLAEGVEVGKLIAFPSLTGNNALAFIVASVTPLVVTASQTLILEDEAATTTDYIVGDFIGTGSECKTYSILTWLRGKCGTVDKYFVTKGVEFTGFSVEAAVSAKVSGTFPAIGRELECSDTPPTGSTFNPELETKQFQPPLYGAVMDSTQVVTPLTGATFTNDNEVSPQFELDDTYPSFMERGNAVNTFSGTGFMRDCSLLETYIANEPVMSHVVANSSDGAMSFSNPVLKLSAVTPERGAATSITLTVDGQAIGTKQQSSLVVQRIVYP